MVPRSIRYSLTGLITLLVIGGPVGYSFYKKAQVRNFRIVRSGVLYRSGQMTLSGLKQVIRDYGIKTVITLRTAREPGTEHPALYEEAYCQKEEINYHRIHIKPWVKENGKAPADDSVREFLQLMKNPDNFPVLVHCFAGKHRTGAYCAIYRMEFENWSNDQAIREMLANGYDLLDEHQDVEEYLRTYQSLQPK